MRSLLQFSGFFSALLLLSCSNDESKFSKFTDPRDNTSYVTRKVDGTVWMVEDLRYGKTTYNYQQALYSCPDGWSLPTDEDWIKLCKHFGGYNFFTTTEGDPLKAYTNMISENEFNATPGLYYWTSTPAWEDAPHIRSYSVLFDNTGKQVHVGSGTIINQGGCRCIKAEKPKTDDWLKFTRSGNQYQFDFYRIDSKLNVHTDILAIMIHRVLNSSQLDRCLFTLKLPESFVNPANPVTVTNATLNHQTLDVTWEEFSFYNASPALFTVTITNYDGVTVAGTFSGQTADRVPLTDGEFYFNVMNK